MVPLISNQTPTLADLDVLQNRVAVAVATRERLIKSWTSLSSRPCPLPKTQEEIDAEDAELFHFEPPHLGLGAPIPKAYLEGDSQRKEISSNEKLRHLILGNKSGHQGSKTRDLLEKASSNKRGFKDDSSDEDEGRSGLGKAKKFRNGDSSRQPHRSESSSSIKIRIGPGVSQSTYSFKNPFTQGPPAKKPLVDYKTDDDSDDNPSTPAPDAAPTPQSNGPPVFNFSAATDIRSGQSNVVHTNPTSKTISFHRSPKGSLKTSSSDSEPSDLETVIPVSLDDDIKKIDSMVVSEAKKAKIQRKHLKKKERQLPEKALTSASLGHPPGAPVGGPVAKKLKDRLLDANGN